MRGDGEGAVLDGTRPSYSLHVHQREAVEAVEKVIADGGRRAWVVLPPGAGKTLVGLEVARRRARKTVVFTTNPAVQSQWLAAWAETPTDDSSAPPGPTVPQQRTPGSGPRRILERYFTVLTYQSLAAFRPDREVDEEGAGHGYLSRLHANGHALLAQLRAEGDLTIVLDECHHLLDAWDGLVDELLHDLPHAFVLGLTATPTQTLSEEQPELVEHLFGPVAYEMSLPAAVRDGDVAPYVDLAWLTTPTLQESIWLRRHAADFRALVEKLARPDFGSVPFFDWLEHRFVRRNGHPVSWARLTLEEPDLCDAALRMVHHGVLSLPVGARLLERHRRPPDADDWALLLDDWVGEHLERTGRYGDVAVVREVRRALPALGYQRTGLGLRKARSPADRVIARSESKTRAAVEIVLAEHDVLGDRLRMLVVCDHQYVSAVLPADLAGVLPEQAGSASLTLEGLIADADHLNPMLVTRSSVAGSPTTLQRFVDYLRERDPDLAGGLSVAWPNAAVTQLHGPWRSRQWAQWVTRFFEDGHCQVLVTTRALLGEGWDAPCVSGVVDLTAATSSTSVVQTHGRALRPDPAWPEKLATVWTVVCATEDHPTGANDWRRFVRKHDGLLGVDADGDVVAGVAHVDPVFSPYAPPPADRFDLVNARMLDRAAQRDRAREAWRVGEPYHDELFATLRVRLPRQRLGRDPRPSRVVMRERGPEVRDERTTPWRPHPVAAALFVLTAAVWLLEIFPPWVPNTAFLLALALQTVVAAERGLAVAREAALPPSLRQLASVVADGLRDTGLSPVGAEAVRVRRDAEGTYRCLLDGVTPEVSETFTAALDEVLSPLTSPRYLLRRWTVRPPARGLRRYAAGLRVAFALRRPTGEVWHPVPGAFATRLEHVQAFGDAWDRWVGGELPRDTTSLDGGRVLAEHRGSDPFGLSPVQRLHWH
jgi:superfamily II DNA or RNA helicase